MIRKCITTATRFHHSNFRLKFIRFVELSSLNVTQKKYFQTSHLLCKLKSKQNKMSHSPSYSSLEISPEIVEELGLAEFEEAAAKTVEVLEHILTRRITTKITPMHLDSIQVPTTEGFTPLKVLSQLSFPKSNMIRLDMTSSKKHLHKAIVALKEFYPFIGVQTHGNDTIEISLLKKDKELRQNMTKDAKKQSENLKSSLRSKGSPILKKLKSYKSLSKDVVYSLENYIESVTRYHSEQIDRIFETKLKEVESNK